MKFARHVIAILAAAVIVALSIGNRAPVEFSLSPVPIVISMPLYQLMLAVLFLGVIAGGGSVYVARLRRWRRTRAKTRALGDEDQESTQSGPDGMMPLTRRPIGLRIAKFRRPQEAKKR